MDTGEAQEGLAAAKDALQNKLSNYPFVVSLSNHDRMPFDKLRANGVCSCCSVKHPKEVRSFVVGRME